MEKPLVSKKYKLEKFPGKGGWTYAQVPEIPAHKHNHFGWVKVKGFIDDHEIRQYHLMPMGNGKLFLPVKASIRKKIKKEAGDWVRVILFADESSLEIPGELLDCLRDEPKAHDLFFKFSEADQKAYTDWIYSAKKMETRAGRIAITIERLLQKKRLHDQ